MHVVAVKQAGYFTTVQDLGRIGYRFLGVPVGGCMDRISHSVSNWLVGNSEVMATLEIATSRDRFLFPPRSLLSISGANLNPVDFRSGEPVPMNRPVFSTEPLEIIFQGSQQGGLSYLAIAGGWSTPITLGSRSTLTRSAMGGHEGRTLRSGDELPVGNPSSLAVDWIENHLAMNTDSKPLYYPSWFVPSLDLDAMVSKKIRFVEGKDWGLLAGESQSHFLTKTWSLSRNADRMGFRLQGMSMKGNWNAMQYSEGTSIGTIQVPSDGQPIVLLNDSAPTGGYPRIGHVATIDLPKLAQSTPGSSFTWERIELDESQRLLHEQENWLSAIRFRIQAKLRGEE